MARWDRLNRAVPARGTVRLARCRRIPAAEPVYWVGLAVYPITVSTTM